MNLKLSRVTRLFVLNAVFAWGCCVPGLAGSSPTNTVTSNPRSAGGSTNAALMDYPSVNFETLAGYAIKVDWLINPTNSAFDSLRRDGNIPDPIKALHGKKVTLQGYIKPLQHDASGVREFLLMRNHALCCQTNVPQINEWVHVRMKGPSLPYGHGSQYIVRGELQVGEVLGAGNVVSVYRLTGEQISLAPRTQ